MAETTTSEGIRRTPLACANCRKGKAKCVVGIGDTSCRECDKKNKECVWTGSNRGKWSRSARRQRSVLSSNTPVPTATTSRLRSSARGATERRISPPLSSHEEATRQISDSVSTGRSEHVVDVNHPVHFKLDSVLFPLGVLAEASRQVESSNLDTIQHTSPSCSESSSARSNMPALGVANSRYFHDSSLQQILSRSETKGSHSYMDQLVTFAQAEELFRIFFQLLNPQLGLLDPRAVNSQSCRLRSPFLFISVCAVASRFFQNGVLYNLLHEHARKAATEAMLTSKSTATVQGFVILATWSQPSVSYETDNAYLYAGIAIRIGVEIGLHRKTILRYPADMDQSIKDTYNQEILSRERTWFCVFTLDRSMSALTGKPPQAPETYAVRDVDKWWRRPECMLSDVYVSALAQLLRLLYRCFDVIYSCNDTVTGVSTGLNYQIVVKDLQWRLDEWATIWTENLKDFHQKHSPGESLQSYLTNLRLLRFFYNLVPLSFGLHHCAVDGFNRVDQISFVTRCYECAVGTLEVARSDLNEDTMKIAPDICVVAIAYAACFLMKLIGPEFRHLFEEATVLGLVEATASLLKGSAEDDGHIHFLYYQFLEKQIQLHKSTTSMYAEASLPQHSAQGVSFMITNPLADLHVTDIDIDVDGTLKFMSTCGVETVRPTEQLSSEWIDNVLGMQSRRDDPFWPSLQGASIGDEDLSFYPL